MSSSEQPCVPGKCATGCIGLIPASGTMCSREREVIGREIQQYNRRIFS